MTTTPASPTAALAQLKPFGRWEDTSAAAPWAVFPRKKLDVSFGDIAAGLHACVTLGEQQRAEYEHKITHHWDPMGHSMIALSIRTGFDLLLQSLRLPRGSEVLCSAITIPDMLYVIRSHGLVPVPVDLDPKTLAVDMEQLRLAVSEKARLLLVAYVFGSHYSLTPVAEFAKENNLLLVEDCAQSFAGMAYTGHQDADVSMFSFGTIKTATSFGGAILRVRDSDLLTEMKRREKRYPSRTNRFFLKRLVKYCAVHSATSPALFGLFLQGCNLLGAPHDQVITSAIRGFSGGELISMIQFRPSVPLLALLHRRITSVNQEYILLRQQKSAQLMNAIKNISNVTVPGELAENHYFWLFPVLVPSPNDVMTYMSQHGFDVTAGATQLAYVPSPAGVEHDPVHAKHIMSSLVYLPITAETPDWAVEKMIKCFRDAVNNLARL